MQKMPLVRSILPTLRTLVGVRLLRYDISPLEAG